MPRPAYPAPDVPKRVRRRSAAMAVALLLVTVVTGLGVAGAVVMPPTPDDLPMAEVAPEEGYRLMGADGGLFAFGHQTFEGAAAGQGLRSPVIGGAGTPTGDGYWMVAADGGVFAYGDAGFHGSIAAADLRSPVAALAPTRAGDGYWLAAADGGVFAFGAALFHGGLAGTELGAPIVDVASTPTGDGYWLVSADGGVFAFGDARYHGGLPDIGAAGHEVVAMATTLSGDGYWLVAADGGVFAFGDATYLGGVAGTALSAPVVDVAVAPGSRGYWLASRDGGVFAFGDAVWHGSLRKHVPGGIVAIAGGLGWGPLSAPPAPDPEPLPRPAPARPVAPRLTGEEGTGLVGNDISYPQCGKEYPAPGYAYGIVGVSGGRAFKRNPCLASQWRWAKASGRAGVYVNVNFPQVGWELAAGSTGPQAQCHGHISCIAYNFGFNGIQDALEHARGEGVDAHFWWLDVETMNYWTPDTELNAVVIRGAIDALREAGKDIGVYSTDYQWRKIAGAFSPGLPVWIAGAPNLERAPQWCARTFGGGTAVLVQAIPVRFDENIVCPGAGPLGRYFSG